MSVKKMDQYKILPEQGGGVCLEGLVDNQPWKTTTVTGWKGNQVRTKSGSVYELGSPLPGMWGLTLQVHRPEIYEKLSHLI